MAVRLRLDQLPPATESDKFMLSKMTGPGSIAREEELPAPDVSLEQVEQHANEEFDYSQKENIPVEDARIKLTNQRQDERLKKSKEELARYNMIRSGVEEVIAGERASDLKGHLQKIGETPGVEISIGQRLKEFQYSLERGALQVAKVPGILLKAYGEQAPTREERMLRQKEADGSTPVSRALDEAALFVTEGLKKAGNNYIAYINNVAETGIPTIDEIEWAKRQPFTQYPIIQTTSAVGESGPAFGAAVAATILTRNPSVGSAIIGTSAATQSYEDLRAEGVAPDIALVGSAIIGSIEVLTEKVPMDALLKGGGKRLLMRMLETGSKEAAQELLAQLGQNYVQAVVKDIDPDDPTYQNLLSAAQQEWSTISEGWQVAMASGGVMGISAAPFSSRPDLGRNANDLISEYQLNPAADKAFEDTVERIRNQVKAVGKVQGDVSRETVTETPDEKPATPTEVQGEGEKIVRGLAQSLERRAVEAELVESLGHLPEYNVLNMSKHADMLTDMVINEPDRTFRILNGEEAVPAGFYLGSLFVAAETIATQKADVETLLKLKDIKAVSIATEYGRNVKAFDPGRQVNTPARDMKEIGDARRATAERRKQAVPTKAEVDALQKRVDELETKLAQKLTGTEKPTRRTKKYGESNKGVKKLQYEEVMARRGKPTLQMSMGVPSTTDLADLTKVALYHMEAIGRNFADWSAQVVRDMGDWVKPYLKDEYNKSLAELERQGIDTVDKKLESYKKRLRTMTGKLDALFVEGDFEKKPRNKIVLDEEAAKLKRQYEAARDKLKAAREAGGDITQQEAEQIALLSSIAAEKKEAMLNSKRRKSAGKPSQAEMEWGTAQVLYTEYVNALKAKAEKLTLSETVTQYIKDPLKAVSDLAGVFRSIVASWDNSFIGRQGLLLFYKGLTLDTKSAKIWGDTFAGSWMTIWNSLTGKSEQTMMALKAMQISDPEYEVIRKTKTDIGTIEEEFPTDLPTKIPVLGKVFSASENAYVWSAHYMRYRVVKMELEIYRNSGGDMADTRQLESIGKVVNSLTGRGQIGRAGSTPGIINNVFFSPRYLKGTIDFMTFHLFDPNVSGRMKKRAAMNLIRFLSGSAAILLIADLIDDESVTWDSNNADFGKIKVGNTRFSVGGSIPALVVLSSRLATGTTTSSVTGEKKKLNTGEFFGKTKLDLAYDFFENKFSPGAQYVATMLRGREKFSSEFTEKYGPLVSMTPLSIQNLLESAPIEDRAHLILIMTAEGLGVNVQTYESKSKKKSGAFD